MKLDSKSVAALTLGDGESDKIFFCDQLHGFGYRLRRCAGGEVKRSWVTQYRSGPNTRRMSLGPANLLTAAQARDRAAKILAEVKLGGDPQRAKSDRRDKDAITLGKLIDDYLAQKEIDVRPNTFRASVLYLRGSYFKKLHSMAIDQVTKRDVAAQLVRIAREHSKVTASLARAHFSAFYVWAMQQGLVEHNPVVGTPKPAAAPERDHVLSDAELVAIWHACDDPELGEFGRIVKLLILTGARRQEIGGIAWSEIDRDKGIWTLPKERAKNGRQHTLPLMPAMLEILDAIPQRAGRDQLFGDRADSGFTVWNRYKAMLDKKAGVHDWDSTRQGWLVHDTRRSVATKMNDIGIAPHIVEEILAHRSHKSGVAGVYNRSNYTREVRLALALWEQHLSTLVTGEQPKSKVVNFPALDA
jgi:integrase